MSRFFAAYKVARRLWRAHVGHNHLVHSRNLQRHAQQCPRSWHIAHTKGTIRTRRKIVLA